MRSRSRRFVSSNCPRYFAQNSRLVSFFLFFAIVVTAFEELDDSPEENLQANGTLKSTSTSSYVQASADTTPGSGLRRPYGTRIFDRARALTNVRAHR